MGGVASMLGGKQHGSVSCEQKHLFPNMRTPSLSSCVANLFIFFWFTGTELRIFEYRTIRRLYWRRTTDVVPSTKPGVLQAAPHNVILKHHAVLLPPAPLVLEPTRHPVLPSSPAAAATTPPTTRVIPHPLFPPSPAGAAAAAAALVRIPIALRRPPVLRKPLRRSPASSRPVRPAVVRRCGFVRPTVRGRAARRSFAVSSPTIVRRRPTSGPRLWTPILVITVVVS